MVVTHELVVTARGPEGELRLALGLDHDPADEPTGYLAGRVARAYKDFFDTSEEPTIKVGVEPA